LEEEFTTKNRKSTKEKFRRKEGEQIGEMISAGEGGL
jgi:hypothetical protein